MKDPNQKPRKRRPCKHCKELTEALASANKRASQEYDHVTALQHQLNDTKQQVVKDLHFQEAKTEMIRSMSVALESCARAILNQPYGRLSS